MDTNDSITVISADRSERLVQFFKDLWDYRDLFYAFLERDIKIRYKQTFLGVAWVILQPLLMSGALAVILGKFAQIPVGKTPYLLFYLAAQVPWVCFTQGLIGAGGSLENNAGLLSKVYFPRIVVPLAPLIGTVPDFCIGLVMINFAALYYGAWSGWLVIVAPVLLLAIMASAGGVGLILAALNAQYRDIKYIIPMLTQLGFLVTVVYPVDRMPHWARVAMGLNPMAGIIACFRAMVGGVPPSPRLLIANLGVTLILLVVGVLFFRKRENKLVDVL